MTRIPRPTAVDTPAPIEPPPTGADWIPVSVDGEWWFDGVRWEHTTESTPAPEPLVWVPASPVRPPSRMRLLMRAGPNIGRIVWAVVGLPVRAAWFVARPAVRVVMGLAYVVGILLLIAYLVAHALPS